MKKHVISFVLAGALSLSLSPLAFADLASDLDAVDAAYQQQERAKAREAEKYRALQKAKQDRLHAEKMAEKRRNQAYEDRLREIELQAAELNLLEAKKLELEMERARVKRANELIDAELAHSKAKTDQIQAQADAQRLEATGSKILQERLGEAAVKKNSGFFK